MFWILVVTAAKNPVMIFLKTGRKERRSTGCAILVAAAVVFDRVPNFNSSFFSHHLFHVFVNHILTVMIM